MTSSTRLITQLTDVAHDFIRAERSGERGQAVRAINPLDRAADTLAVVIVIGHSEDAAVSARRIADAWTELADAPAETPGADGTVALVGGQP